MGARVGGRKKGGERRERERGTSFNFHPGSGEISVAAQRAERKDGSATKGRRGPQAEAREGRGARRGAGFGPGAARAPRTLAPRAAPSSHGSAPPRAPRPRAPSRL